MIGKIKKWITVFFILLFLLISIFLFSLMIGEIYIPFYSLLFDNEDSLFHTIIFKIRLPRSILAIAVGGSLSLSGVVLQTIFKNPLVEPYTIGISGGASLAVTIALISGLVSKFGSYILSFAGFIGSIISILIIYLISLSLKNKNINNLLLIGVMISFISSSLITLLLSISSTDSINTILFWTMGSLNETNTKLIYFTFSISLISLFVLYFFTGPLNALRLGEIEAQYLGINTSFYINLLLLITSILTGTSIAIAGIIGFVGLIIPHIIKSIVGTDHRILIITSYFAGGIFLLLCDIIARTIISPNELPVGVVTGIIGGIVFIVILTRTQLKLNSQ